VRATKKIYLVTYVQVMAVPLGATVRFAWAIALHARLVAHHGWHTTLATADPHEYWAAWAHTFTTPGIYSITGTVSVAGTRGAQAAVLTVTR
jgi:plastocyanin